MTAGRVEKGGEFLLTGAAGKRIFTPGDFPPDRRQIAWTAEEIVRKEVLPDLDRKQFGRVIGEFGAIREKLADRIIEIFALETVALRAEKGCAAAGARGKDLLGAVVKVALFSGAGRFQAAASRCTAYALRAKRLFAEASREDGRYVFRSHES
jgi:alkylation response protein AidB-like acyl-CoA dehydrogenase